MRPCVRDSLRRCLALTDSSGRQGVRGWGLDTDGHALVHGRSIDEFMIDAETTDLRHRRWEF